jgi:hypothetical protein
VIYLPDFKAVTTQVGIGFETLTIQINSDYAPAWTGKIGFYHSEPLGTSWRWGTKWWFVKWVIV